MPCRSSRRKSLRRRNRIMACKQHQKASRYSYGQCLLTWLVDLTHLLLRHTFISVASWGRIHAQYTHKVGTTLPMIALSLHIIVEGFAVVIDDGGKKMRLVIT